MHYSRTCRLALFLLAVLFAEASLVSAMSLYHPLAVSPDGVWRGLPFIDQIFSEALVLLALPFLVALVVGIWLPRTGMILGVVSMTMVPVWVYLDRLLVTRAGVRVADSRTYALLLPIFESPGDYLANSWDLLSQIGAFAFIQIVVLLFARCLASRISATKWRGYPLVSGLVFLCLATTYGLITFSHVLDDAFVAGISHPLYVLGVCDPETEPLPSKLDLRCIAKLVEAQPDIERFAQRYAAARIADRPEGQLPDIVMVMVESFRYSAVTPATAPNLTALASESIVSTHHYSTGNATFLGYFGALYGINTLWYQRAMDNESRMHPLLPRILGELGYYRAFLGSWVIGSWKNMDSLFDESSFDLSDIVSYDGDYVTGDRETISRAISLLKREGELSPLANTPVFLMLQCNTTHWNYHHEPVDAKYGSVVENPLIPADPHDIEYRRRLEHRYLSSVHCMDRLLKPLIDVAKERSAILLIMGDHGESLGEDGASVHCTALTESQTRTLFYLMTPNKDRRAVRGTSHLDVAPTLLDILKVRLDDEAVLHGTSLLRVDHMMNRPFVVSHCYDGHHAYFPLSADEEQDWYYFRGNLVDADFRLHSVHDRRTAEVVRKRFSTSEHEAVFRKLTSTLIGENLGELPPDGLDEIFKILPELPMAARIRVFERLSQYGPIDRRIIPEITRYLNHPEETTRAAAAKTLESIRRLKPIELPGL